MPENPALTPKHRCDAAAITPLVWSSRRAIPKCWCVTPAARPGRGQSSTNASAVGPVFFRGHWPTMGTNQCTACELVLVHANGWAPLGARAARTAAGARHFRTLPCGSGVCGHPCPFAHRRGRAGCYCVVVFAKDNAVQLATNSLPSSTRPNPRRLADSPVALFPAPCGSGLMLPPVSCRVRVFRPPPEEEFLKNSSNIYPHIGCRVVRPPSGRPTNAEFSPTGAGRATLL